MKRSTLLFLLLILFCAGECAAAGENVLHIPFGTESIAEEAFFANGQIDRISLPDGLRSIGDRAFAECSGLLSVNIPPSVEEFGEDIFSDIEKPLLLEIDSNEAAVAYAIGENVDFDASSTFRALFIGNTEYPTGYALHAPQNDVQTMKNVFANGGSRSFSVTIQENVTASQILSSIASAFSEAQDQDISLFYYSGHGRKSSDPSLNGSLVGIDYASYVTAAELRGAMDRIPGRKIVIIDACYSGTFIEDGIMLPFQISVQEEEAANAPSVDFMNAFLSGGHLLARSAGNSNGLYYIITACASTQESFETKVSSKYVGLFTYYLSYGCGYDCVEESGQQYYADSDGDGIVTVDEAYEYAKENVTAFVSKYSAVQDAQVYPQNCYWLGMIR